MNFGNPKQLELAMIGVQLAYSALDDMVHNVHAGPCTCQKPRDQYRDRDCASCEMLYMLEDCNGLLWALNLFDSVMQGHSVACPEPVKKLREYLRDNWAEYTPEQLAKAILRLDGADAEEECDAPALVVAGR